MPRLIHPIRSALLGSVSAAALILAAQAVLANPTGGSVEAGHATISTTAPGKLQITQSTDKAIINWQSFNIGQGETTQFHLPKASSVTLNRDVSGDPSKIFGTLQSNGQVYLVNRAGILFGKTAHVNVAGLVATTQDIKSSDFMAGKLNFDIPGNPAASVINEGDISIADYGIGAFVAPHVRNDGAISARLGKVALASAKGFTLDLYGDNLITFLVQNPNDVQLYDTNGKPVTALVENHGAIAADGGQVYMTAAAARGVVDSVINTDGIVQADTVAQQGGKIILGGGGAGTVTVSGKIHARGTQPGDKGGTIIATGQTLVADQNAFLDVSGPAGGGKLLFGGDYHGGDKNAVQSAPAGFALEPEAIANAQNTTVEAGAQFAADATKDGTGGKVVVWSDQHTEYAGAISAKGAGSGAGGNVEVSGKQTLGFNGTVNLLAPTGNNGTLLLDPENVTIADASTSNMSGDFTNGSNIAGGTGDNAVISASAVSTALQTESVAVTTGVTGTQAGDITVNEPLSWSANTTLILDAAGSITINAPITVGGTTNAAGLSLRYGQLTGLGVGATENVNAPITMPATASFTTRQGSAGLLNQYKIITTAVDLAGLSGLGQYALGDDIDMQSLPAFSGPVIRSLGSTSGSPSRAIIDGLGHKITNLTINSEDLNVGLIGTNQGDVRNLSLQDVNVSLTGVPASVPQNTSHSSVGGLIGYDYGGTVNNVYVSGTVRGVAESPYYGVFVGGVIGSSQGDYVSNARSNVAVSAVANKPIYEGDTAVGAFAGGLDGGGDAAQFDNVSATGDVSVEGKGAGVAGGLIGIIGNSTVTNSYATGDISDSAWAVSAGGLLGELYGQNSIVSKSFSRGNVLASSNIDRGATIAIGGFSGVLNASVSECASTGNVSANNALASVGAGGFSGVEDGSATNIYATGSVSVLNNKSYSGSYVGGLIGVYGNLGPQPTYNFQNAYSTGTIAASIDIIGSSISGPGPVADVAGSIGFAQNRAPSFKSVYWDTTSAKLGVGAIGENISNLPIGITHDQMLHETSFLGFNFTNTWTIDEGVSPPRLRALATSMQATTGGTGTSGLSGSSGGSTSGSSTTGGTKSTGGKGSSSGNSGTTAGGGTTTTVRTVQGGGANSSPYFTQDLRGTPSEQVQSQDANAQTENQLIASSALANSPPQQEGDLSSQISSFLYSSGVSYGESVDISGIISPCIDTLYRKLVEKGLVTVNNPNFLVDMKSLTATDLSTALSRKTADGKLKDFSELGKAQIVDGILEFVVNRAVESATTNPYLINVSELALDTAADIVGDMAVDPAMAADPEAVAAAEITKNAAAELIQVGLATVALHNTITENDKAYQSVLTNALSLTQDSLSKYASGEISYSLLQKDLSIADRTIFNGANDYRNFHSILAVKVVSMF